MTDELRRTIRGILLEELAAQRTGAEAGSGSAVREEVVRIDCDRDLAAFVRRLMSMAANDGIRADIESGRLVFRLEAGSGSPTPDTVSRRHAPPAAGAAAGFERKLVTERDVRNLPDDVTVITLAGGARLTPLASDALRQAGIKVQKVKS